VIIACYCTLHAGQILDHRPRLVFVDESNAIRQIKEAEAAKSVSV
jgi:aspartate 1-decarboxylase